MGEITIKELFEILLAENPIEELVNHEEGVFKLIPELAKCKNFPQNSKWHIYDVYGHILHAVGNVPPDIVLRLTALFHDVGKPSTYTEDENHEGHFPNHWGVSKEIFDQFALTHNLDKELATSVSNLIYYHDINIANLPDAETKKMCKLLGITGIKRLFQIKRADLLAQNPEFHGLLNDYDKQEKSLSERTNRY